MNYLYNIMFKYTYLSLSLSLSLIELIDRNFLDARNKQLSKIYAFYDGWLGNYTMS